jgi:zinc and cadmium transporter
VVPRARRRHMPPGSLASTALRRWAEAAAWSTQAGAGALLFNLLSALTFLLGGWVAYGLSGRFEVTWLLPFAAGNFIYIAAADLLPELTVEPAAGRKALLTAVFVLGLGLLMAVALVM